MLTFILLSCAFLINARHSGENGQPPHHNPAIEPLEEDQSLEVDVPSDQDIIALCLKNGTWTLCLSADEESEGKLNLSLRNGEWTAILSTEDQQAFDKPVSIQDMRFVRLCLKNGKRSPCALFKETARSDSHDLIIACKRNGVWGIYHPNDEDDITLPSDDDNFSDSGKKNAKVRCWPFEDDVEDRRLRLCLKNKKWTVCPSTDEDHEGFVNICHKNDRWSICKSPDEKDEMMFDAHVEDSAFITLCHKNDEWSVCTDPDVTDELDIVDFVVTCLRRGKWGRCPQKEEDEIALPSVFFKAFEKCIENVASTLRNFAEELFRFEDQRLKLCVKNKKWSVCPSTDDDHEGFVNICQKNEKWTICKSPDEKDEAKDNTPAEDMGIINLCENIGKWSVCHSVKDKEEADDTSLIVTCLRNGQWGRCLPAEEEHFTIPGDDDGVFQMCLKNKKWSLCSSPTMENEGVIMLYYMNGTWSVCHPTDAEEEVKNDKNEKWSAFLYDIYKKQHDRSTPVQDTDVFKLCLKNNRWSVCLSAEEEKEADDIAVFPLCRQKGLWLLHMTAEQERSRYLRHERRMMKFLERTLSFDN
ncbi:hypothetical protein BLNAU_18916 [Blattamonas nauphoetae]|uniref:Uncharacterized protein n=1 Tax=Blattamonas nauphoetae TaxID=2049346 RepID=A0ABQ9X339_9EUKA|nr:hypothetical protein BLNAU_18916 [Blattamonas nauphoetae]